MRSVWKSGLRFGACALVSCVLACGDGSSKPELPDGGETSMEDSPSNPLERGEPMGDAWEQEIGPEGGELRSPDGRLSLTVPAGALSATQTLRMQEVTPTAPHHTGKSFRLSPEGIHFEAPVSLTFHYDDADVEGSAPELLRVAYQDEAGRWHMYKSVTLDPAAQTVRVESDHFSDWSLVLGAQILPLTGTVKIGEAIELRVMNCMKPHEESEDDITVTFGYDCESEEAVNAITWGWSVNGVLGGNDRIGYVRESQTPGRAIYTPPRSLPAGNPVAVSVTMRDYLTELFPTTLLISHIRVIDDSAKWSGSITVKVEGTLNVKIPEDFTGSETHTYSHETTFEVGTVTARDGQRTELTFNQVSSVSYEMDGSRRKEVHEICQAGGPVILRHLFEYSVASWLVGRYEGSVPGNIWISDHDGSYSIGVRAAYIPLAGQEVVVDKYTHFCYDQVTDGSYTKGLESSEPVPQTYFEGTLDPEAPNVLAGSVEKTVNDKYMSKLTVEWNLVRGEE